jgi:hypothetical protein
MNSKNDMSHLTKGQWVFYAFLIITFVLLFTEHRAHVLGLLPYLFLLACPLMHLFMHHGHSQDHDNKEGGKK